MRSPLPIARTLTRTLVVLCAPGALAGLGACHSATEPGERVYILDVAATRVPCTGSFPQLCIQVRERSDAPYTLFYDPIRGFSYEPGYRYQLLVGERAVANPPADGPSATYRLIEVMSKVPAPS